MTLLVRTVWELWFQLSQMIAKLEFYFHPPDPCCNNWLILARCISLTLFSISHNFSKSLTNSYKTECSHSVDAISILLSFFISANLIMVYTGKITTSNLSCNTKWSLEMFLFNVACNVLCFVLQRLIYSSDQWSYYRMAKFRSTKSP